MRAARPSRAATRVSFARGLASLDEPRLVEDPLALALVPPGYGQLLRAAERSPLARRAVRAAWDLLTGRETAHIARRTRAIDDAVREAATAGARQLVLIGAGLDARAFRLDALEDVTVFELDHPSTQAFKKARVADLRAKVRAVRFVEIDLEREPLARALLRAGHDAAAPTIFLWEGLTAHLSRAAIEMSLRALSEESCSGSTLIATYAEEPARARRFAALRDAPKSAFTPGQLESLFARHGFHVARDESDADLARRYQVPGDGATGPGSRSPERLVVAEHAGVRSPTAASSLY